MVEILIAKFANGVIRKTAFHEIASRRNLQVGGIHVADWLDGEFARRQNSLERNWLHGIR
jgi:hypothetical protein